MIELFYKEIAVLLISDLFMYIIYKINDFEVRFYQL